MDTIRVSLKPYVYQGLSGYRVRWIDPTGTVRSYFVQSRDVAKDVKRRAKNGQLPSARQWAVKV